MVIIQGDDFVAGDSMMTPGHVLAEKEIIVVTLNYRLGALGEYFAKEMKILDLLKGPDAYG